MEDNWAGWRAKNVEHAICRMLEFHGDKPSERMAEIREIIIDDRFKRGEIMERQPIETAPRDGTEIMLQIGRMSFPAKWEYGFINDEEKDCGGWVATEENHHPECWTDGVCWQSNADGFISEQPTGWQPLPAVPEEK